MKDKKFTDEEIIKALECCYTLTGGCENNCPMYDFENCNDVLMAGYVRGLIERQKAEIERLQKEVNLVSIQFQDLQERTDENKAEAYKEFAKRIQKEIEDAYNNNLSVGRKHISKHSECPDYEFIATVRGKMTALQGLDDFIDNLLKEMVGEKT